MGMKAPEAPTVHKTVDGGRRVAGEVQQLDPGVWK
jgi:hypothetical protein